MKGSASERILTLVCAGVEWFSTCMACRDDFRLVFRNDFVLISYTGFEIVRVEMLLGKVSLLFEKNWDFKRGEERREGGFWLQTSLPPCPLVAIEVFFKN